jgi:hypothetical protein
MIENPDSLEATMKITMTLKEWTELRDQLSEVWPSSILSQHITNLLSQGRKVFYSKVDDER